MDNDIKILYENDLRDLKLIEDEIGSIHRYYAQNLDPLRSMRLDLYLNNVLVGQAVIYWISSVKGSIGVIYYVAINKRFRGRGLGKILVLSAEEILSEKGSIVSLATMRSSNKVSTRLFGSLNYDIISWDHIIERFGSDLEDFLLRATCGYEDDLLAIKDLSQNRSMDDPWKKIYSLYQYLIDEVERHWRNSCYMPWRRLYRS